MPHAVIDRATSGNGTAVIAGIAGYSIRIHGFFFVADGSVDVKFESGDGITQVDMTGVMTCVAASGVAMAVSESPIFVVPKGKSFYVDLSGNVQVSGAVIYSRVG